MIILSALALKFLKTFRFIIYYLHHIVEINKYIFHVLRNCVLRNNEVRDIILNNASPGWDNI